MLVNIFIINEYNVPTFLKRKSGHDPFMIDEFQAGLRFCPMAELQLIGRERMHARGIQATCARTQGEGGLCIKLRRYNIFSAVEVYNK